MLSSVECCWIFSQSGELLQKTEPLCQSKSRRESRDFADCCRGGKPPKKGSMEHSLHKQLKMLYCESGATQEVKLGDYRIDVVDSSGLLIEIQHSSLSAINRKCQHLLDEHRLPAG